MKISSGEFLTFDDLLLLPGMTSFSRQEISLRTRLTRDITLESPLVSSPMDTVTEDALALALGKKGGIGIIHRNLSLAKQASQVKKVSSKGIMVGGAVGVSDGYQDRVKALVLAGVSVIVVDSAHGFSNGVIDATKFIKKKFPKIQVIAGSIATGDGARALIRAGADGLRVGMGPGAICTTRVISGIGVPQASAIKQTHMVARKAGVPIIADGGIKYSGDMVKALALGADTVMMGSFFAATREAPGRIVKVDRKKLPHSLSEKTKGKFVLFKQYRGMGSIGAMRDGAKIKSEDEYHGKSYKDRVLVAEGVEGLVPLKGEISFVVEQALGGIRSGMYYVGAKNILELQHKAKFIRVTNASLREGHPHDILITNPGENY